MRTFIAIELDKELKKNLSLLVSQLDKGQRNVKWVDWKGMHLTLKFLGETSEEKVPEIENILRKVQSLARPFLLKLKGTGYFPPQRKNPRVLWVGVEEQEILMSLVDNLETELEKIGFPREKRKFHPHLTLGRVKSVSGIEETLVDLEKHRDTNFGEMIARKITFFQSVLKPTGAEYTVISEFGLR